MDILYYSNFCPHSKKVLQYIAKNNLIEKMNCICIDNRKRDVDNNQIYIILENGKRVIMPPNVHSVPAMLQVKHNYNVILGDDIIKYYSTIVSTMKEDAVQEMGGEPLGISLNSAANSNITSEKYTSYNMTPDELSAKGNGSTRQMYNYVPATHNGLFITTPPDTYRPDKVASGVTVDVIQQQRNSEVPQNVAISGMNLTI